MQAGLIAGHYALEQGQGGPLNIGGLRAYAVRDTRDQGRGLMAVQTRPALPPRAKLLTGRHATPIVQCLMPVDRGPGRDPAGQEGWFIICPAPLTPALSVGPRAWTEQEIVHDLLLPAAAVLEAFNLRGVTHRAIRPDNVFRAGPGEPVTLGPCWAAPPASMQPVAFEPAYSASCLPSGRGEGVVADDVYALGVLMLWCALGPASPVVAAWQDEAGLLQRKLEMGCYQALTYGVRLSPMLTDLLRGMLAEEPDHRPPPSLLLDPAQARARRVAARPSQRAQRPLELSGGPVWSARELAFALRREGERAAALLRSGLMDRWLRRMVGDAGLAVRLEEAVHRRHEDTDIEDPRSTPMIVMSAIAVLDPLGPLVWRGVAFFPDGLGPVLATAQAEGNAGVLAALEEALLQGALLGWTTWQTKRREMPALRQEMRDWQIWLNQRGAMGGIRRLTYALNPLLPCASPLLGGRMVARLAELLPALDDAAGGADRSKLPIDPHIAAFIAARAEPQLLMELGQLDGFVTAADRVRVLDIYARIQSRASPVKLAALAGWLLSCGIIDLSAWRNLETRRVLGTKLAALAAAGELLPILLATQGEEARAEDAAGAAAAAARLDWVTREVAALKAGAPARAERAVRDGQDIAGALGLVAALAGVSALLVSF